MIESSTNAQIKKIQKLKKSARNRRKEGLFIAEGVRLVEDALAYRMVEKVYLSENVKEEYFDRLSHKLKEADIEYVSSKVFQEISDTESPQGVLAVVQMPGYDRSTVVEREDAAVICLEDIQDPGNLGTIFRTAEGAGMSAVIMSAGCVDLFNPKVVRSTMGALFRVPFYLCDNLTDEIDELKKEGFTTYAAHLKGDRDYTEPDYNGKAAIVIGNEARGITEETAKKTDALVKIPMEGELESLNAVSAALFMYEIHRKR